MSSEVNHFELFGLETGYEIDLQALETAYERLTMESHPDFFASASEADQAAAQQRAARVNEGYRVLKSESARAAYLLGLLANGMELDTTELPEGFLQEMFFLQEELDELEASGDQEKQQSLKRQFQERRERVVADWATLFGKATREKAPVVLQTIQSSLNCVKYLNRLLDRLP